MILYDGYEFVLCKNKVQYMCSGVFDARCSMPPTSWEELKMDFKSKIFNFQAHSQIKCSLSVGVKRKYLFRYLNGSRYSLYDLDTLYSYLTRSNVSGTRFKGK